MDRGLARQLDTVDFSTPPVEHHGLHLITEATRNEQIAARFAHLGKIRMVNKLDPLKDYAGKALPCNFELETDNPHEAAKLALEENLGIVFRGALTSATGNFGPSDKTYNQFNGIIAIKPKPLKTLQSVTEYIPNKSDQVVINRDKLGEGIHTVTVGAGLTYDQVNQIVAAELGPEYWVAVDLTSIKEAYAGAVYATNGQGPSGIQIPEIATRVNLTDGREIKVLTDQKEIEENAGLAGHQGGVTELEIRVLKRPTNRLGFRLILKDTKNHGDYSAKAAKILAKLSAYAKLNFDNGVLTSAAGADSIDGQEIMDKDSVELVRATKGPKDALTKKILDEMERANSDYCIYITGNSTRTLQQLLESDDENILHLLLELEAIADIIPVDGNDALEAMREIRENIPDIAKKRADRMRPKPFSTSLDFNFRLNLDPNTTPTEVQEGIYAQVMHAFYDYEQSVITFVGTMSEANNSKIEMQRYGHLGRDPHTRFTIIPNEGHLRPSVVHDLGKAIGTFKKALLKTLQQIQKTHPELEIYAGEKGRTLEISVLSQAVADRTKALIEQAGQHWNFRAPKDFQQVN